MNDPLNHSSTVAIIGAGPAGLIAADVLSQNGISVDIYDSMPSVGRKFLLAGVGGMNLTHSESFERFVSRYREQADVLRPFLQEFGAAELREWAHQLGIETFTGSSGRVFPSNMKAAPLLRAWLHRLRTNGVRIHVRHKWEGWNETGHLLFSTPQGRLEIKSQASIFALGGGSWAKLGSDAAWVLLFQSKGIPVSTLKPSNCGFNVNWTEHFRSKFAGSPIKPVVATVRDINGETIQQQGEFNITAEGVEGNLIYAFSALIREIIHVNGFAEILLDLAPGKSLERLEAELAKSRGSKSMANHLRARAGIEGVKAGLLHEYLTSDQFNDPHHLAATIKVFPLKLISARPLDEAISSAGGIPFTALNENLMLEKMPGVFCAGEMLDWEAPTGGYLLTACFATGYQAGKGLLNWLHCI